jgi:hypothetical protein
MTLHLRASDFQYAFDLSLRRILSNCNSFTRQ